MGDRAKVLLIDNDGNIADFINHCLSQKGFEVQVASTGFKGLKTAKSFNPDLVILDLTLPDIDGIDICSNLRSISDTGILILTARNMLSDRILGLEAGADDYLSKPFAFEELIARIRAILRRNKLFTEDIISTGDLEIDINRRQVKRKTRIIELTSREFELLKLLAEHKGRPLRKEYIFQQIWGMNLKRIPIQ